MVDRINKSFGIFAVFIQPLHTQRPNMPNKLMEPEPDNLMLRLNCVHTSRDYNKQLFLFLQSYSLRVSKDGKDFNERVKVDARKKSETFHLQQASSGKDAGDIIYDFQKVINID